MTPEQKRKAALIAEIIRDNAHHDTASYSHMLRRELVDGMAERLAREGCSENTGGVEDHLSNVFAGHPDAHYKTFAAAQDAHMHARKLAANEPTDDKPQDGLSREQIAKLTPRQKLDRFYGLPVAPPTMTKPEMSNTRRGTPVRAEGDFRTAEQIRNEAYSKILKANAKK